MRLFLAIELPEAAKKRYAKELQILHKDYPYFQWMDPARYHITLFFFGELESSAELEKQIEQLVYEADCKPFHLFGFAADLFMRGKLLIYANFHTCKPLQDLVFFMKPKLKLYEEMDQFIPHMTIATYKIPSKQQYLLIRKKLQQMRFDVEFPVADLVLYEAATEEGKSVYKEVRRFPLEPELEE